MNKHFTLKSLLSQSEREELNEAEEEQVHNMRPRRRVIQNILNYSKALHVYQTSHYGAVTVIMN
jgi:hypothetical protein